MALKALHERIPFRPNYSRVLPLVRLCHSSRSVVQGKEQNPSTLHEVTSLHIRESSQIAPPSVSWFFVLSCQTHTLTGDAQFSLSKNNRLGCPYKLNRSSQQTPVLRSSE